MKPEDYIGAPKRGVRPAVKIDRAIVPMPSVRGHSKVSTMYPWLDLDVGRSFFIPIDHEKDDDTLEGLLGRVASRCNHMNNKHKAEEGYVWRARIVNTVQEKGVRVWRLK